jgi:hypothetical protein
MLKFTPHFVLILAAFVFSACPYSANVPLSTPDTMSFDPRILGHWKSPYLTAEINGIRIAKNEKGQLIANEFSREKGTIKYDKDTLIFSPTRLEGLYFIDQKSDTAALWTAHPYFFSLDGNVLSTYSLNDTLIGKDRKFASSTEYREFVAHNIFRPRFMENPDVMMRVTEGELRGDYIDLMVTDTSTMHLQQIAYAVRVSDAPYLSESSNGKSLQKNIRKIERRIKQQANNLRLDSISGSNDHGFEINQFCFTAKSNTMLEYQKKHLKSIKNVAVDPISFQYSESMKDLSPILDSRMAAMAGEMAKVEFPDIKQVEQVVSLDAFDERAELLRENTLEHAMKISTCFMEPYQTIYDWDHFVFSGRDQPYWKIAIYRVWLK